ncbi:GNAT family N-acetyltransferase [Sphingomonas rubra]|uniref:Acetyltransferase (GNAT) domain-containing protein n=1 Tax=Sphingomonas rubra TaxID=634430 RepID=A0A1I5UFP2_9SPHN|nr:GNAT family N-acetyltransferase [Sphingomonas rubra]SFP94075.1 Acetyltransferase (GNAT) domain-containing protein [Sphingomonas rubra]
MALIPVEPGQLATVVTSLSLYERPRPRPLPPSPLRLERWAAPSPARYRALFARVGGPWLWFSRLVLDDAGLTAIVGDPLVEVHAAVDRAGVEVGMVELDFRGGVACTLAYFGLVPELAGRGIGGWMMAETLARAWRPGVARVDVNTCTLDHPAALGFYRRHGFVATGRTIETFADPRIAGILPRDAAPQVPLLDQSGSRAARAAT